MRKADVNLRLLPQIKATELLSDGGFYFSNVPHFRVHGRVVLVRRRVNLW